MTEMHALERKATLTLWLTRISFTALLLLLSLWYLWLHPVGVNHPWVIWLIHVLPLACFIPTVRRASPRGHAWLCFVLLLYFNEAVLAAFTQVATRNFGLVYAALVMVLFTAAMLYARWGSQYQRLTHGAANHL